MHDRRALLATAERRRQIMDGRVRNGLQLRTEVLEVSKIPGKFHMQLKAPQKDLLKA